MQPGDKVRLKANPGRVGILGNETDGPPHRFRVLVTFTDGEEQFVLKNSLEKVDRASAGPYAMVASGRYGRVEDLRGAITYYRLKRSAGEPHLQPEHDEHAVPCLPVQARTAVPRLAVERHPHCGRGRPRQDHRGRPDLDGAPRPCRCEAPLGDLSRDAARESGRPNSPSASG
jgi:hypothetical protein